MNSKMVEGKGLADLVAGWLKEYEVFAPLKRDGIVVFDKVGSADEIMLDYPNTTNPPKELLFPQAEELFSFSSTDDLMSMETHLDNARPRLLLGVRPCDARSLLLLDKVFDGNRYKDVYYLTRRANTLVAVLGCVKPRTTCFCTAVGGGPFSEEGADLFLADIGDTLVVKAVSERGARLVEGSRLDDAGQDQLASMESVARSAEAHLAPAMALDGLSGKLESMFDHPAWGPLTETCLGCGVCTYLCTTCHCFDIVDDVVDSRGARMRLWDSCQFPQFTLQASGFNPRPTSKERLRQRVMHKFCYFPQNHALTGCVGCGRCVVECPVNLDIRDVLTDIMVEKVSK